MLFCNASVDQLEPVVTRHDIKLKEWTSWLSPYICLLINTGLIDSRLRSIAEITPRFLGKAKKPISAFLYDEHSHTVNYTAPIKREEIMDMVGFQKLLDACLKKDIMLTIKSIDFQTLRIKFDPTSRFSKSSFWKLCIPMLSIVTPAFFNLSNLSLLASEG